MTDRITAVAARLWPLFALVAFALVPYGWIAEKNPWFKQIVYRVFATEAAHAVGHSLIFIALGAALLAVFPMLAARPWLYFGIILALAVGQEGLQLLYKGRGLILNDLTDIGIDLTAAYVVLALARAAAARRAPWSKQAS